MMIKKHGLWENVDIFIIHIGCTYYNNGEFIQ